MTGKRKRRPAPRFLQLHHRLLKSHAWHSLTPLQRCGYIELAQLYDGTNNGRLAMSVRRLGGLIPCGKNADILRVLEDAGFIETVKVGRYTRKEEERLASEYRLTDHRCDVTGELPSRRYHPQHRWNRVRHYRSVRRIGFNVATLSMDEGARVEWAGEGKGKRTSPLKLTRQTGLDRLKVAALIVATNEMLSQADVKAELIIRNELVRALARAVDSAFLDPANSGSANVKPASVTNGAAGISDSPGEALWEFYDTFTGDPDLAWIIMHPFTAARLSQTNRPLIGARGGSWAGFPVLTSSVVEADTWVFLDPSQIAVATDGPEIRTSTEATVELADSTSQSTAETVTAAQQTSMFQTNSSAILSDLWANWRVMKPEAVMTFTVQQFGL